MFSNKEKREAVLAALEEIDRPMFREIERRTGVYSLQALADDYRLRVTELQMDSPKDIRVDMIFEGTGKWEDITFRLPLLDVLAFLYYSKNNTNP